LAAFFPVLFPAKQALQPALLRGFRFLLEDLLPLVLFRYAFLANSTAAHGATGIFFTGNNLNVLFFGTRRSG